MRMAGAVTIGVLIIEALLVGAFLLGFYWLDGLRWGLLFSGIMLLLIALPWLGELKVVFDSAGPRGAVKVGWWARVSFAQGETAMRLVVRVLGIPIRRRIEPKQKAEAESESTEAPPEFEPAVEEGRAEERTPEPSAKETKAALGGWWKRVDSETVEGICRVVGSSLGATCELVCGAEEIRISVRDPAERARADMVLEQVFGRRQVGPLDVMLTSGPCDRRVRAVYRIGLLRAALAGAQVVIDGRVPEFVKQMKRTRKRDGEIDEDQRIIEEIVEQSTEHEEED